SARHLTGPNRFTPFTRARQGAGAEPNTEVRMMTHRRRRISRVLLGVLALTIVVGVFAYVRKLNPTRANEVAASGASPQTQPQQTQPQSAPQSQPSGPVILAAAGAKAAEPPKQALPQPQAPAPAGPLRTETPSSLVTQ